MIAKTKTGWSGMFAAGGLLVVASLASGCSDSPPTGPPPTYTVGGAVSGLAGSGLVLRDNGGDDLPVSADGAFAFATELAGGAAYSVTVFTQPSSPAQHCTVTTGSGTIASANVTTVAIACTTTTTYTVGGTVTGLVGSGLVLRNNGGDDLSVTANGPVVFGTPHASGDSYSVTVLTQPTSPAQTCLVTDGRGTSHANVTTVAIVCITNAGMGAVRVTVATTGPDAPATDTVHFDGQYSTATAVVPANGAVSFDLAPGAHTVSLSLAQNCISLSDKLVTVATGVTTDVAFSVTCVAAGTLQVTVATTGPDAPAAYPVYVGPDFPVYLGAVPSNGMVSFAVRPGGYTVNLGVAENCSVTSSNGESVTVAAGAATQIAFSVTCVARGTIKVTIATTGTDAPPTYMVTVSEIGFEVPHRAFVHSNGTVSFKVAPGSHTVVLYVPRDCAVSGNTRHVTVAPGATAKIAFSVNCGAAQGTRPGDADSRADLL